MSLVHGAQLVKTIRKSTFPGGRSGLTQFRQKPTGQLIQQSYGYRKIIETIWKTMNAAKTSVGKSVPG